MTDRAHRAQIAARLRRAREAAGLSQGQVAKKLKLHRPTITEIEAGRRRVSADELTSFSDIYGVSVEWIAQGESGTASDDSIFLAARHLTKMKEEDLERLMELIKMLRRSRRPG